MALLLDVLQVNGVIVLHNVPRQTKTALGIEDLRVLKLDSAIVEVQTEVPASLAKVHYDTAQGEIAFNGVVSATAEDAILAFGAIVEAARAAGSGGGGGGVSPVEIEQSDVSKFFAVRNNKIVRGDSDDNVVLFSIKRNSASNVTIKNIQVNIILESNDYIELQYHKNPTFIGGGTLLYSSILGASLEAASGSFGNPSDINIGNTGNPFEVLGYCQEKNYGKEFSLNFSILLENNTDQHVFSAVCSGNDTKIKASIYFEEKTA